MIIKEVLNHEVALSMHFLICGQFFIVADADRGKDKLGQLREDAVTVVFADGKVDIVTSDHVEVQAADLLDVLPLTLVLIALDWLAAEAVPKGE